MRILTFVAVVALSCCQAVADEQAGIASFVDATEAAAEQRVAAAEAAMAAHTKYHDELVVAYDQCTEYRNEVIGGRAPDGFVEQAIDDAHWLVVDCGLHAETIAGDEISAYTSGMLASDEGAIGNWIIDGEWHWINSALYSFSAESAAFMLDMSADELQIANEIARGELDSWLSGP